MRMISDYIAPRGKQAAYKKWSIELAAETRPEREYSWRQWGWKSRDCAEHWMGVPCQASSKDTEH